MDWRTALGLVASLIILVSIVPYILDTLRGSTRPNIVTWSLWTLTGAVLAAAQYSAGASWTLAILVSSTVSTSIVTILAVGYGQSKYGWFDGACLVMALTAILGWAITANPLVGIVLGVLGEMCAVAPTVLKTYRAPQTETSATYWLTNIATVLALIASTRYDLANILFPIYALSINTLVACLAMRRPHKGGKVSQKT
ncbi:MAG TPA: hypothetical protein VJ692_16695 [Nitrospiraceae bacterium]|nr:hypothetical protein [Nitrospiraceae bacterium]